MGKKQHYVPRLYLRRFAIDVESPSQIRLFHIRSSKYVQEAKLYNQCYKNYFYGKSNVVENYLGNWEGKFASMFREIDEATALSEELFSTIALFIGMQWTRTTSAAHRIDRQTGLVKKGILAESLRLDTNLSLDPELIESQIERMNFGHEDPVLFSLKMFAKMAVCISDLKARILTASPKHEFITSDNPVVPYNKYCEGVDWTGVTGAMSAGLMIFLPLSPRKCLLLYDAQVYKVGSALGSSTTVFRKNDIDVINALQYVGADNNLYFSSDIGESYFKGLVSKYEQARLSGEERMDIFPDAGDSYKSVVGVFSRMPRLNLKLSFVTIKKKASKVSLTERAQSYRSTATPPDPLNPSEGWTYTQEEGPRVLLDRGTGKSQIIR